VSDISISLSRWAARSLTRRATGPGIFRLFRCSGSSSSEETLLVPAISEAASMSRGCKRGCSWSFCIMWSSIPMFKIPWIFRRKAGARVPKIGSILDSISFSSIILKNTSLIFLQTLSLKLKEKPLRRRLMKGSAPSYKTSSGDVASLTLSSIF
jgi:hypothetical protein